MTAVRPQTARIPLETGHWSLDQAHSSIVFSIRHFGLSKVRGRFDRFDAAVDVDPSGAGIITATIDLGSIDTNNRDRDAHLRSTDFFDTDKHPEMTFRSTAIDGRNETWRVAGDITLNGITRPLTLDAEFNGIELFVGDGKRHAGFTATGTIRRSEFGIDFGALPIGVDKLALGDDVRFEIDIQLIEPS